MPSRHVRIEPYRAADGADQPLVAFCLAAGRLLAPFAPPDIRRDEQQRGTAPQPERLTYRLGDERQGVAVTREREWQPQTGALVVEHLRAEAYGLPQPVRLAVRVTREWYAPRYAALDASADDEAALDAVAALFQETFGQGNEVLPDEVPTVLGSARAAVSAADWRSASIFAEAVLAVDPRQADALFYLGVARGAQGDTSAGLEALLLALEVDPAHHDALYNLGVLYLQTNRPAEAAEALEESLRLRPGNHPVLYTLGRAYEALGNPGRAAAAYRQAVASAPNPQGYWGFRGMDLTEDARRALERLGQR